MNLEALAPRLSEEEAEDLLDLAADIRHDLGKYVVFEARFAGPDASVEERRAALRADLLATRRGPRGVEPAWAVWARLRPAELAGDPDVERIDAALAALRGVDLDGDAAELERAAALAAEVAEATRRLDARARRALGGDRG